MKKLIKRLFGGLLNLFKSPENPLLKAPDYSGQKISSRGNYKKMGPLEIDTPVDNNTYGPYNLPGITVTAPNLKKALPFPYGQINVEANNGRTLAYPSGNSPLQEAVFRNKAKRQIAGNRGKLFQTGGELPTAQNAADRYRGGLRTTNSYKNFGDSVSVRGVQGISPWYKKSPIILETIRHSKSGPDYNDTTYAERPAYFPLLQGNVRAATNSKYLGKRNSAWSSFLGFFLNDSKASPEGEANYNTLQRRFNTAWGVAKHQEGGLVERADNTRVSSGRPQLINNKIPYGAGKGPAADSPMRLFNDPYVNIGLMAMGPLAKPKVQHDVFPVKEVLKFSFLPLKEIMTRMTTKYGNYLNIKGPKGRVNAWKIERLPGVDNFTEIQNLLFK